MYVVQESDSKDGPWHPCTISVAGNPYWARCEFEGKREAEAYAYLWCHNATKSEAIQLAPLMEIGIPVVFQTELSFNEPVFMRIIEK